MITLDIRFIRFLIAGSASIPFNLAGRVMLSTFVSFEVAVVGAQLIGMLVAYLAMRCLVFEASGRSLASELMRFATVNAFSLAQTWVVSVMLVAVIPSAVTSMTHRQFIAHFLGLATTTVTSFLLHRSFSFRAAHTVVPGDAPTEPKAMVASNRMTPIV